MFSTALPVAEWRALSLRVMKPTSIRMERSKVTKREPRQMDPKEVVRDRIKDVRTNWYPVRYGAVRYGIVRYSRREGVVERVVRRRRFVCGCELIISCYLISVKRRLLKVL